MNNGDSESLYQLEDNFTQMKKFPGYIKKKDKRSLDRKISNK